MDRETAAHQPGTARKGRLDLNDPEQMDAFFSDEGASLTDKAFLSRLLPPREVLTERDLESVCGGISVMDWAYCRLTGK